jgi:hypothetical protein
MTLSDSLSGRFVMAGCESLLVLGKAAHFTCLLSGKTSIPDNREMEPRERI